MSNTIATERVYSFSAGPAVLPEKVLEQVRDEMMCLPGAGNSILEIGHRTPAFDEILRGTENRLRSLLGINDDYSVLFLQGGSRLQFSMVPMNLLSENESADYLVTGSWSQKAAAEAKELRNVNVVYDGKPKNFNRVPTNDEIQRTQDSKYMYYTSNETIQGIQFQRTPTAQYDHLVCDASSDFLSRPIEIDRHAIVYACAQKNAGPAGVTVVIIRKDLLDSAPKNLPSYMQYKQHADNDSRFNTPPTFAIYVMGLILKWIEDEVGSLDDMRRRNESKAAMIYDVIDRYSDFYVGHAVESDRSMMNVTFRFANETLDSLFKTMAADNHLTSLGGHRSVGGIRASIYNAMPIEGVKTLADFMNDFAQQNG